MQISDKLGDLAHSSAFTPNTESKKHEDNQKKTVRRYNN